MKHLYAIKECSEKQVFKLIRGALELWESETINIKVKRSAAVALIFLEDSTRTRLSFERACQYLNLNYVNMHPEVSSLKKGETLRESVEVLRDYGVNCFVIRSKEMGIYQELSQIEGISLINAGEGTLSHPTHVLGDAAALCIHLGASGAEALGGYRLALVGDLKHSRVARSWSELAKKLKIELRFVCPEAWSPGAWSEGFKVFHSLSEGLDRVDGIMALRVQNERHESLSGRGSEYSAGFQVNEEHLQGRVLLHPGPTNWGVELDRGLQAYPNSLISLQRQASYYLRMYLLSQLCK